jgi:hypothetical protein
MKISFSIFLLAVIAGAVYIFSASQHVCTPGDAACGLEGIWLILIDVPVILLSGLTTLGVGIYKKRRKILLTSFERIAVWLTILIPLVWVVYFMGFQGIGI